MRAKDLKAGDAYIVPIRRTPAWRSSVALCARATVIDADRAGGMVVVELELPRRDGGLWPAKRETVRSARIVGPWAEMDEVRRRERERLNDGERRERERLTRHARIEAVIGLLSSLEADDIDVSWSGERVTLRVEAFLGLAELALRGSS